MPLCQDALLPFVTRGKNPKVSICYNGRKKAKIDLMKSEVLKLMNNGGYVVQSCVSIMQLCAWAGCGTPTGYVKQISS